jgi:hypothetical protein
MTDTEVQCVALAAMRRVAALDDFGTGTARRRRRRISTVVRHHQHPIGGAQLRDDRPQRRGDLQLLVMRGNEDGHSLPRAGGNRGGRSAHGGESLDKQHCAQRQYVACAATENPLQDLYQSDRSSTQSAIRQDQRKIPPGPPY